jgi:hypothetical protein
VYWFGSEPFQWGCHVGGLYGLKSKLGKYLIHHLFVIEQRTWFVNHFPGHEEVKTNVVGITLVLSNHWRNILATFTSLHGFNPNVSWAL